ncbi:MAG TPA: lipopolysaccharide biosynthesis protein RfbH [Verrucomicrobia subdivision 3 bacterium]|nr:lipopolysaccharide biosynthesis protein RfbH [Limisphaerales bacterium]
MSDLESGLLKKTSFVRVDRAATVHFSQVKTRNVRLTGFKLAEVHKALALRNSRAFSDLAHRANLPASDPLHAPFIPGQTIVPYAGRVFTEDEVEAAVSATLDFWLTLGPEGDAFENELAALLGVKKSILVNSGSSANLVAMAALTSQKLGDRQLRPGDEVITSAAGFPTTVAPILQNGCVPVFIDNDPSTLNGRTDQLEAAFAPGKTKAVMMAHTLGNPFDLAAVLAFCKKHQLWLIEDNCDALGCTYSLPVDLARELGLDHLLKIAESGDHPLIRFESGSIRHPPSAIRQFLTAPTGTFGDLSTQSFYPPHHLTMGEGGAVNVVRDMKLKVFAESFRDWGRDCWCPSGKDNTCHKRFGWQLGELPEGYDHKYIYSHLGYNLKPLDPQAAIGRQQLKKLPAFIQARKDNWNFLRTALADLEEFIEFQLPTHATAWNLPTSDLSPSRSLRAGGRPPTSAFTWDASGHRTECSWFGFMMLVKKNAPFTRREFAQHLDAAKIGNRMLFGGNLVRQPAFVTLKKQQPGAFRVVGDLAGADRIMNEAVFIGTYPGLTKGMLDYMIETITRFCKRS